MQAQQRAAAAEAALEAHQHEAAATAAEQSAAADERAADVARLKTQLQRAERAILALKVCCGLPILFCAACFSCHTTRACNCSYTS